MPGRPPLCLRCGFIGHVRLNCIMPYCRHCERYGHSTEECVPTYANTLANRSAPQQQAPPPPPPPAAEKSTENEKKKNYKNQKEQKKKTVSSSTDDDTGEWQVATGRKKRKLTKNHHKTHTAEHKQWTLTTHNTSDTTRTLTQTQNLNYKLVPHQLIQTIQKRFLQK